MPSCGLSTRSALRLQLPFSRPAHQVTSSGSDGQQGGHDPPSLGPDGLLFFLRDSRGEVALPPVTSPLRLSQWAGGAGHACAPRQTQKLLDLSLVGFLAPHPESLTLNVGQYESLAGVTAGIGFN